MVLAYTPLQEYEIRLVTILPAEEGSRDVDDFIKCQLAHFSIRDSDKVSRNAPDGGNISFDGLVTGLYPEYLNLVPETPPQPSKISTLSSRFKEKTKQKLGRPPREVDPFQESKIQNYSINVNRQPMWEWTAPKYPPPEDSPTRYTWGDYVALSYMCGDERQKCKIIVNGQPHMVTRNLENALRELRRLDCFGKRQHPTKALRLWVDQLCINQGNEQEKLEEMSKMAVIYRQAGNVVAWLTKQEDFCHFEGVDLSSNLAIDYMQWLSAYYRTEVLEALDHGENLIKTQQFRHIANFHLRNSLLMITTAIKNDFDYIDIDEQGWIAIFHFANNPYWKRLWIIQELCMGRPGMAIMYSGRITQWRYVRDSALIIAHVYDFVADKIAAFATKNNLKIPDPHNGAITHIAAIAEIGIHGQRRRLPHVDIGNITAMSGIAFTLKPGPEVTPRLRGTSLQQLLFVAGQANCSYPEDRVWGLLAAPGVSSLTVKRFLGMSVQDVYLMFALQCLQRGERIAELSSAQDDEMMINTETTTVTTHGAISSSTVVENYADRGVTYTYDIFASLDGFGNNLLLPSWVPDLSKPAVRRTAPMLGPWCASGPGQGAPPPPVMSATSSVGRLVGITCRVVSVGQIDGIGAVQSLVAKQVRFVGNRSFTIIEDPSTPDSTLSDPQYTNCFDQGVVQCKLRRESPDEEEFKQSLSRVLVAGADSNGKTIDAEYLLDTLYSNQGVEHDQECDLWLRDFVDSSADFVVGQKPLREWFSRSSTAADFEATEIIRAAKRSMFSKMRGRRLIVTKSMGYLGLAPMAAQPGDTVGIIVGYERPVIIRPQMNLGDTTVWRIIGDCFVDGVMEGEVATAGFLHAASSVTFV